MLIELLILFSILISIFLFILGRFLQKANLIKLQNEFAALLNSVSSQQQELITLFKDNLTSNNQQISLLQNSISQNVQSILISQRSNFELLYQHIGQNQQVNELKLEKIRTIIEEKLTKIQEDNSVKLEKIRATVEEKLYETLEKRLGESFQIVSERLEMVHKGLGEMQTLAAGVGDLKKVLTNVKTRGIWGEVQLNNLLQQLLTSEQYESNVAVRPNSQDRVEYAIKLPGRDSNLTQIWLPIDAKFPLSDYQRLVEAQEQCNVVELEIQTKLLDNNIKKSAKMISDKYINPPFTTDFAIMFLPIEGMYAEVLRRPGLIEKLQSDYRVIITSPTTLSAILNSLQMGFKTLAIEKRSSEVWKMLEIVRKEFLKFADILNKTKLKLEQAGQAISEAENRSKIIHNKLSFLEENDPVKVDSESLTIVPKLDI